MALTLAFDIYGTLINTQSVAQELTRLFDGDHHKAHAFAERWREKQLEYSFRRGLMQHYASFAVCTRDALNYTDLYYQTELDSCQKQQLLACYNSLPTFADVTAGLAALAAEGHALYAFSNGSADAVESLLQQAGIRHFFKAIVSVEDLCSYKPNPAVYAHFMRTAASGTHQSWLISGNPFDVIGARSAGMQAAWLQRSPDAVFDPWGIEPTVTVHQLTDLAAALTHHC